MSKGYDLGRLIRYYERLSSFLLHKRLRVAFRNIPAIARTSASDLIEVSLEKATEMVKSQGDGTDEQLLLLVDGLVKHELLHHLFTPMGVNWLGRRKYETEIYNIVEDAAIENFAPSVFSPSAIGTIGFMNDLIYQSMASGIQELLDVSSQMADAGIAAIDFADEYGVNAINDAELTLIALNIHGVKPFAPNPALGVAGKEKVDRFCETAFVKFDDAVQERDAMKRLEAINEIIEDYKNTMAPETQRDPCPGCHNNSFGQNPDRRQDFGIPNMESPAPQGDAPTMRDIHAQSAEVQELQSDGGGQSESDKKRRAKELEGTVAALVAVCEGKIGSERTAMQAAVSSETERVLTDVIDCEAEDIQLADSAPLLAQSEYISLCASRRREICSLQNELTSILMHNAEEIVRGSTGRLSVKRLLAPSLSSRVFERHREPTEVDDVVAVILMDCSGSTRGNKHQLELEMATVLYEALTGVGIKCAVMSYSATRSAVTAKTKVSNRILVPWDSAHSLAVKANLVDYRADGCNRDGDAIRVIASLLAKRKEGKKLLIVVSDGLPSAYSEEEDGVKDTKAAVRYASRIASVTGIFLNPSGNNEAAENIREIYGRTFLEATTFDDVVDKLGAFIKEEVKDW